MCVGHSTEKAGFQIAVLVKYNQTKPIKHRNSFILNLSCENGEFDPKEGGRAAEGGLLGPKVLVV